MCETVKVDLFYELNSDCRALYETGSRIKSFKTYRASALSDLCAATYYLQRGRQLPDLQSFARKSDLKRRLNENMLTANRN